MAQNQASTTAHTTSTPRKKRPSFTWQYASSAELAPGIFSQPTISTLILFENVNDQTSTQDLRERFSKYGDVTRCSIARCGESGPLDLAVVGFASVLEAAFAGSCESAANEILSNHEEDFRGGIFKEFLLETAVAQQAGEFASEGFDRVLEWYVPGRVPSPRPAQTPGSPQSRAPITYSSRILAFNNLPSHVTEADLLQRLTTLGKITRLNIYKHKSSGLSTGVGCVEFATRRDAAVAMAIECGNAAVAIGHGKATIGCSIVEIYFSTAPWVIPRAKLRWDIWKVYGRPAQLMLIQDGGEWWRKMMAVAKKAGGDKP